MILIIIMIIYNMNKLGSDIQCKPLPKYYATPCLQAFLEETA